MRRSVPLAAAAVAVVLVMSACGDSGDEVASSDTTEIAAATIEEAATTEPAVDGSSDEAVTTATEAPAPTEPPSNTAPATSAAPATTAAPAGDGECLNGNWRADSAEMQRMIDALGVPMTMTIDPASFWSATIDNGAFVADSAVTLSAGIPGGGMTLGASGGYHMEGTYTVDGNAIVAETVVREGVAGDWTATIDGVEVPLPAGASFGAPPDVGAPDFNGSTFTCNDTTLIFNVPGAPVPDITYTRVS